MWINLFAFALFLYARMAFTTNWKTNIKTNSAEALKKEGNWFKKNRNHHHAFSAFSNAQTIFVCLWSTNGLFCLTLVKLRRIFYIQCYQNPSASFYSSNCTFIMWCGLWKMGHVSTLARTICAICSLKQCSCYFSKRCHHHCKQCVYAAVNVTRFVNCSSRARHNKGRSSN